MTLLRLTSTGVARSHFAVSPLAETVGTLIALHRSTTDPWLPVRQTPSAYRAWLAGNTVAAGLLGLVATTKWFPDVVAVPPAGGRETRFADELADVAAFSDTQVRATIDDAVAASHRSDTSWLPTTGAASHIAAVLEEGWHRFVEPDWPRRQAVIDREITYRADLVAAHGWQKAVTGMTRRSTWVAPDAIRFNHGDWQDVPIGDNGLTFVPYTTRQGFWTCEHPPRYAFVYPARGPATHSHSTSTDPLSVLLGPGRARIARELTTPTTSSTLATTLNLSLGTISAHLAVLRKSGIATRTRSGRHVLYRLTDRGTTLLTLLHDENP
ncbi:ArsR/SmtB family transcription factor [Umezawaea sp. NPDC059074]|uniref:ArsR/SmtB family transcription factor n=1 Tax=Umezawaea sp. NPDC059074 TaxID=3346716 RepID=UPI0036CCD41F